MMVDKAEELADRIHYEFREIDSHSPYSSWPPLDKSWELLRVFELTERMNTMSIPYTIKVYRRPIF